MLGKPVGSYVILWVIRHLGMSKCESVFLNCVFIGCFVLFCFVLFCFVLSFVLFCYVLFCFEFCFVLFCFEFCFELYWFIYCVMFILSSKKLTNRTDIFWKENRIERIYFGNEVKLNIIVLWRKSKPKENVCG